MFDVSGWNMWLLILLFVIGLVLIIKGGDFFVDAATWFAEVSGIPKFIVGATIVSIATTLPELIVSSIGAARGTNALAVGNAVGSVTANTGLIMAISLICMPAIVKRSQYMLKSILLMVATAILYAASFGESFSLWGSVLLLIIFVVSMTESIISGKKEAGDNIKTPFVKKEIPINIVKFLLGAAGIVFGAEFLVDSATEIAVQSGVSQAVISATIVAIGTSLPELVTTITAVAKKQSSLSVGNIVGANLIDITVILPICSFISQNGLTSCAQNLYLDIPVCLGLSIIALVPMLIRGKFSKWQGIVLLAIYVVYVAIMAFFNPFAAV
jgi:cation:H+ antiporter